MPPRGATFLILSYVLMSALPFLPLALGQPLEQAWQLAGVAVLSWLLMWALGQGPQRFHWLLLPAMLAIPVEVYLRLYFSQGISTHHLGVIAETSPKEALEFLGTKIWLLFGLVVAIIYWWWRLLRIAYKHPCLRWRHRSRPLVVVILVVLCGCFAYGNCVGVAGQASGTALSNPRAESVRASLLRWPGKLPAWAMPPVEQGLLSSSWPFGLAMHVVDFWNERQYLQKLAEKSRNFRFQASQPADAPATQTVLMVIGESSRYDRWSLNGYRRPTNPLLAQESNLVSLRDMITAVSATRLSVPIIVSRKPATLGLQAGFSEKSFLSAYKEAGFKTFWLSNQMSFGSFDTPVSVFAKEADVTEFLNLGGFTNNSSLDSVLQAPLQRALADASPKKLIVLHTLGNHWNYSHRYPAEFDRWQPSLYGIDNPAYTDLDNKPALNNSYDNSILYTDAILASFIEQLKGRSEITSMMYVSDHGQTLYDGSCKLAFHGHNTQFEFHIPALVWYSDAYREQYPDKVAQLKKHQKARLSTENVFHSLLDMADIRYPDEQLDRSFVSPAFKVHTRYVDSYGWTNYDNANFKGDCREVIGKKKPLPQRK